MYERDEALEILGDRPMYPRLPDLGRRAQRQRGGIDSDPLVRLLAFRAWGERDRRWFADRGVRAGEPVAWAEPLDVILHTIRAGGIPTVARTWGPAEMIGEALADGPPGKQIQARIHFNHVDFDPTDVDLLRRTTGRPRMENGDVFAMCRISDRVRMPPEEQSDLT